VRRQRLALPRRFLLALLRRLEARFDGGDARLDLLEGEGVLVCVERFGAFAMSRARPSAFRSAVRRANRASASALTAFSVSLSVRSATSIAFSVSGSSRSSAAQLIGTERIMPCRFVPPSNGPLSHRAVIRFLNTVNRSIPPGKQVHVALDNYPTHKHPKVLAWLARHCCCGRAARRSIR
jgi:hypothetical protein